MIGKLLMALLLFLIPTQIEAWETRTPSLGIRIVASDAVVQQYERHWFSCTDTVYPFRPYREQYQNCSGLKWGDIGWGLIDLIYESMRGDSKADPSLLTIKIKKLQYSCVDEEVYPGYEMTGCIDGYYASSNSIWIHLGDDSGQGTGFGGTALTHELEHYFKFWNNDPTWRRE